MLNYRFLYNTCYWEGVDQVEMDVKIFRKNVYLYGFQNVQCVL